MAAPTKSSVSMPNNNKSNFKMTKSAVSISPDKLKLGDPDAKLPPGTPLSVYPKYSDFGKSTKDFFTKGFQVGNLKLNIRDQMSRHINATMTGTHDLEKKEAEGDFQATLTCPFLVGYRSTTKWTTGNVITQELHSNDGIAKGVDVGLIGTYDPEKNAFNWKSENAYRHDLGTVEMKVGTPDPEEGQEGEGGKPLIGGALVTGYQDFALGYEGQFDIDEKTMKKNNVAASFVKGDLKVYASLDNAELLWAGIVYKLNSAIEAGLTATYKSDPEGYYVVGGALKYVMDCCTALKVKFDSDLMLGLGFETKIRPTATITMSAEVDGNKLEEGGHKVGLCFDLEA